jgi:ATP-dependent DNA ligase I
VAAVIGGHGGRLSGVLLADLAAISEAVAATSARGGKVAALADGLRAAGPAEVPAAVAFLSGELRQRQIGVGWAALRELPAPAVDPTLTVAEADAAFAAIGALSGPGSRDARRAALADLFARATASEQRFLRALLSGDLRQGALAGVMTEAAARAADVPSADLRRALMLHGEPGTVAAIALTGGVAALRAVRLEVGRPVQPMLASPAAGVEAALERLRPAAVEYKLDGARIQVHRDGGDVAVFTRSLDDITARVPEVVAAALELPVSSVVLDGEAIALRADGRPEPFQVTGSRIGSAPGRSDVPLSSLFFDVLHADGEDLLDAPGAARAEVLAATVPEAARVPRHVVDDAEAAAAVLRDALAHGHEGVVVKSLAAPYAAGRRGADWLKVKPVHTLDLVVLAAEWGHGRRRGRLSNLHLGARHDSAPGTFVMLGKTFKGLTDAMLEWQTERLLELAVERTDWAVRVRPELVVEIAFDGVQTSSRYPGGVALRFARVLRHRPDKSAAEADTLAAVLAVRDR